MNNKYQELANTVDQVAVLLDAFAVRSWADDLGRINERIKHEWAEGPILLLECFGGMGSLTDINICPENNHIIKVEDVRTTNAQLRHLLSKAYGQAQAIVQKNSPE